MSKRKEREDKAHEERVARINKEYEERGTKAAQKQFMIEIQNILRK